MVVKMESAYQTQRCCNCENASEEVTNKKYIGNHLTIHLPNGRYEAVVVGNHNRVTAGLNDGTLKVIGDKCTVKMEGGKGNLLYTGNGGRILLGNDVRKDQVVCVGNKSKVSKVNGVSDTRRSSATHHGPKISKEDVKVERPRPKTQKVKARATQNIMCVNL